MTYIFKNESNMYIKGIRLGAFEPSITESTFTMDLSEAEAMGIGRAQKIASAVKKWGFRPHELNVSDKPALLDHKEG